MNLTRKDHRRLIRTLYVTILSREPTVEELAVVEKDFEGKKANRHQAAVDLVWGLVNSKEFLCRH